MSKFRPLTKAIIIHETPMEEFRRGKRGSFYVELDDADERRLRITFSHVISLEITLADCVDWYQKGVPVWAERYVLVVEDSERIARMALPYKERNPGDDLMERVKHYAMRAGDHWIEVVALGCALEYL